MENILFIFNIILTVCFTISLTGFYVVYRKNKKREFLFISLFFILMIIENSIVYLSEFSMSFEKLYETSDLLYIAIYLILFGIVMISRLIVSETFQDKFSIREKQLSIILPIVLGLVSYILPFNIGELAIYSSFYVALFYIAYKIYKNITNSENEFNDSLKKKYKILIIIIFILCIVGIVESSSYFMSYNDESTLNTTALSLEYRNIAFDMMKLLICFVGLIQLKVSFENLFDHNDVNERSVDEKLQDFCIKYALTHRQKEIVELIIEGCSNKEISEKLFITEGTVKTHVYNIFKKVDISNRNQLLKKILHD